jgi:hypothetical protein
MADDPIAHDSRLNASKAMNPAVERVRLELTVRAAAHDRRARHRAFIQLASVAFGVVAITWYVERGLLSRQPRSLIVSSKPEQPAALQQPPVTSESNPGSADAAPTSLPQLVEALPATPPAPALDRAVIAAAEAELDAASRDRARAEDRAGMLARRLSQLTGQAALDAGRARKLAFVVRDPSTRIAQASSRGGFLRGERTRLEQELTTLRQLPRAKYASILSKSPVARPAEGDEYHFELRRNRITVINLVKLLELTKADAQVRIRMADRLPAIAGKVGPVGAFSLEYELARAVPGSVEELLERRSYFNFRGWELVPDFESRGETFESTRSPLSEFSRAVNRITPGRATITLWVYPDSFSIYGQIRDELIERGYSVAARPLPEGMTIRGSPMGTHSAAQ